MADNPQPIEVSIIAQIAGLLDGLGKATAGVKTATDEMGKSFSGLEKMVNNLKAPFIALASLVAGGAMFKHAMDATVEWTMECNKLSKVLNTSVQDASAWGVMMHTLGVSGETLQGVVARLQMRVTTSAEAFKRWGVETKNAHGGALPMANVIENMASKYQSLSTDQEKNAMLTELAGRGWLALLPIMRATAERLQASREEAAELHLVIGPDGVATVRAYQESMRRLDLIVKSLQVQIGTALMPTLTGLGMWMGSTGGPVAEGMANLIKFLASVFSVLKLVVDEVAISLSANFKTMVDGLSAAASIIWKVTTGDLKGAWAVGKAAARDMGNDWALAAKMAKASWEETTAAIKALWNPPKAKPTGDQPDAKATPEKVKPEKEFTPHAGDGTTEVDYKALNREALGMAKEEAREEIALAEDVMRAKEGMLAEDVAMGRVSAAQKLTIEKGFIRERAAAETAALTKEQAEDATEIVEWTQLENRKKDIARKSNLEMGQVEAQALEQRRAKWEGFFGSMTGGFSSAITGLIRGTKTWGDAFRDILNSALDGLINFFVQWGIREAIQWAASMALGVTSRSSEAAGAAAVYAVNAAGSAAAIPGIGWMIAPGVGSAAYIEGMAWAGMASAAGGWDRVPSDQIAQIHKNEMVLSAPIAEGMRNLIGGGGAGGSVAVHIHANDAKSFNDMLKRNQGGLMSVIAEAVRNGRRS